MTQRLQHRGGIVDEIAVQVMNIMLGIHGLVLPRHPSTKYNISNFQETKGDDIDSIVTSEDESFRSSDNNVSRHIDDQQMMDDDAINLSDEEKKDASLKPAKNAGGK